MTIHFVVSDRVTRRAINHLVAEAPEALGQRPHQMHLFVDEALDAIRADLGAAAVVLDPDSRRDPDVPNAAVRDAAELLAWLLENRPQLPVVLVIKAAGGPFDIKAILHPRVWGWDMSGDPAEGPAHLEAVLQRALAPSTTRRLKAVISFAQDSERLSVQEDGIWHFRDRPLLTQGLRRQRLHALASQDLDPYRDEAPDIAAAWRRFEDVGSNMLVHLFDEVGEALLSADSLEFRFDIAPEVAAARFELPLELLCRAEMEFLCKLRPMARRMGTRAPQDRPHRPPHILFVDASAAKGFRAVLLERKLATQRIVQLTETANDQFAALQSLERDGYCTAERLDLEWFRALPESGRANTFEQQLKRRLTEPEPGATAPDILHFCGHGISRVLPGSQGRATDLIVPQGMREEPELLPMDRLSKWLPNGVRLVFLAACQSVSAQTARELHYARGCSVIGFRWKILASSIPRMVSLFYDAHLRRGLSVAAAYREACGESANLEDTAWASAVALAVD